MKQRSGNGSIQFVFAEDMCELLHCQSEQGRRKGKPSPREGLDPREESNKTCDMHHDKGHRSRAHFRTKDHHTRCNAETLNQWAENETHFSMMKRKKQIADGERHQPRHQSPRLHHQCPFPHPRLHPQFADASEPLL